MALVRIDEKTLVQKIKFFIIGHQKPNWLTRISVVLGFVAWLYYTIYFSVIFLSILFVDSLENPELIKSTFGKIGGKYNFNINYAQYNWEAIDVIFYHALITILLLLTSLIGLVFIYRRKKMGYILYLAANVFLITFTLLFMGIDYTKAQITFFDKSLLIGISIYFLIILLFNKRTAPHEAMTE
ncbi:MAG: hypothetical protein AB8B74_13670 [Crocinitomicaceae bacterium]